MSPDLKQAYEDLNADKETVRQYLVDIGSAGAELIIPRIKRKLLP